MSSSRALLLGLGTFVVCAALCVALFEALDVELTYLLIPIAGVAFASYSAYKAALEDGSG